MKRWDFTVYTILMILLVDKFIETESAGYLIMIVFMIFSFGKKHFDERAKPKQTRGVEQIRNAEEAHINALLEKVEALGHEAELDANKEGNE